MIVFGFDVGTGSLGAVIRQDNNIIWHKSWNFPSDFGSTAPAGLKRRALRTRTAHRAREYWWNQQAKIIGLPLLKEFAEPAAPHFRVIKVDDRLKREFPTRGDDTVYTSSLLRVMILDGQISKLSDWQIYKAIHSAIQKRGYGPVPWEKSEDPEEQTRVKEFNQKMDQSGIPERYRLPCYFEAHEMGLWNPKAGIVALRQNHTARTAETVYRKGYTAPRSAVELEIKMLLTEIKRIKPELDIKRVMCGPDNAKPGHASEWQSLLGQKTPRFNNRVLADCRLIPRFHVVRADNNKLWWDVHLLMKLHNTTVVETSHPEAVRKLKPEELDNLFNHFRSTHKATAAQLKGKLKLLGLEPAIKGSLIDEPKKSGRTSFSKPALYMLRDIYLSGLSARMALEKWRSMPSSKNSKIGIAENKNPKEGLVLSDLEWLMALGDTPWDKLHIPEFRLAIDVVQPDRLNRINEIIGENNNPVVRHRLHHFIRVLKEMSDFCGGRGLSPAPDRVCIEYVREDFMSGKKLKDLQNFQKHRKDENKLAREQSKELGLEGSRAIRLLQLWKRQNGQCPYTGKQLSQTSLADYEIDHIVPRSANGPDASVNLILTTRDINREKGDRTPFQWLAGNSARFSEFQARLDTLRDLPKKTKILCISPDAGDLVTRYTDLAGTAWIARLTQRLVHIFFRWDPPSSGAPRRFEVISGALTAGVRAKYGLNKLLNHLENKKDRSDPRHHILDAMIISFMKSTDRKKIKDADYELPDGLHDTFKKVLANHAPKFTPQPPTIEENFYGIKGDGLVSKKLAVMDLAYTGQNPKFSLEELRKKIAKYREDEFTSEVISDWLEGILKRVEASSKPEEVWLGAIKSTPLPNGTIPRTITWPKRISREYRQLESSALHGPALIKPKDSHKGFFVVKSVQGKEANYRLIPVYVFNSKVEVRQHVIDMGDEIIYFLRPGYVIQLNEERPRMPKGLYVIKTLMTQGTVVLESLQDPKLNLPKFYIARLIKEHGFKPHTEQF
jgi:CRISPR-associated endonuclease Csn1